MAKEAQQFFMDKGASLQKQQAAQVSNLQGKINCCNLAIGLLSKPTITQSEAEVLIDCYEKMKP